jgi:hypothetical protein
VPILQQLPKFGTPIPIYIQIHQWFILGLILAYLLSAAPEHDEVKHSTIEAALMTGSAASDFAGSAVALA